MNCIHPDICTPKKNKRFRFGFSIFWVFGFWVGVLSILQTSNKIILNKKKFCFWVWIWVSILIFFLNFKIKLVLGPGCGPKTKPETKINSEFNSIHFGIEINKHFKFLTPKNVWLKISDFSKNFILFFSHFLDPITYGC